MSDDTDQKDQKPLQPIAPHVPWLWAIYGLIGFGLAGLTAAVIYINVHPIAPTKSIGPSRSTASVQPMKPAGVSSDQPLNIITPTSIVTVGANPSVTVSPTYNNPVQSKLGINVIINHDGGLVHEDVSAPKGYLIHCALENKDTVSHTLTLSNGESVTAAAGQTAGVADFTLINSLTYTVSGYDYTGTIKVD